MEKRLKCKPMYRRCVLCRADLGTIPSVDVVAESTKPLHTSLEPVRLENHHTIRNVMAEALRDYGYAVYEEVLGVATNGSNRRIDIIAFRPSSKIAMLLDPTSVLIVIVANLRNLTLKRKPYMSQQQFIFKW
ncbi:hypothetical protein L9F63_017284 [Diploptera punctata]|uniref:Uncharacterized protein n=1 Tax=Diploptera punctata TaxID=6984 RepID=A0AAD7ZZ06_DIPPU|nr:hypothetical protein L9F63_017284 [Diploptera punctata]